MPILQRSAKAGRRTADVAEDAATNKGGHKSPDHFTLPREKRCILFDSFVAGLAPSLSECAGEGDGVATQLDRIRVKLLTWLALTIPADAGTTNVLRSKLLQKPDVVFVKAANVINLEVLHAEAFDA